MVYDGRLALGMSNSPSSLSLADSVQVFCMATNVYLVFWRGYDALQLRHLEKWYFLFAYGLPAIAPIVYVILDHQRKVPILGPATVS